MNADRIKSSYRKDGSLVAMHTDKIRNYEEILACNIARNVKCRSGLAVKQVAVLHK
jgi:hypothetical protein